jgi:hypothetical protein
MTIDETVDLDLTFAKLAEEKEKDAFFAGCIVGWEAGLGGNVLVIKKEWQDYKNGK